MPILRIVIVASRTPYRPDRTIASFGVRIANIGESYVGYGHVAPHVNLNLVSL